MEIQNNIAAKNASRNQGITRGKLNKSLERLSSGYKLNRAGDNAAGLAITESMRHQINALDQSMRNVNDGISLTQTGDGALAEVHSMLQRMKTLSIQAANGSYNSTARLNIESERLQLNDEIDRISQSTDFDDIPLFNELPDPTPAGYVPPEAKDEITLQIGHTGDETLDVKRYYMGSRALLLDGTDFTSVDTANAAVNVIENAIETIADVRASFGASQNHLYHTENNLAITKENIQTAESKIRDTDMAEQITQYTSENIILQASNSMLAHANNMPDMVINLIQGLTR